MIQTSQHTVQKHPATPATYLDWLDFISTIYCGVCSLLVTLTSKAWKQSGTDVWRCALHSTYKLKPSSTAAEALVICVRRDLKT